LFLYQFSAGVFASSLLGGEDSAARAGAADAIENNPFCTM
jgi:hypothetical protein